MGGSQSYVFKEFQPGDLGGRTVLSMVVRGDDFDPAQNDSTLLDKVNALKQLTTEFIYGPQNDRQHMVLKNVDVTFNPKSSYNNPTVSYGEYTITFNCLYTDPQAQSLMENKHNLIASKSRLAPTHCQSGVAAAASQPISWIWLFLALLLTFLLLYYLTK